MDKKSIWSVKSTAWIRLAILWLRGAKTLS